MYSTPHGEYIQVWTPDQLPVARRSPVKNYIKEDAEIYATPSFTYAFQTPVKQEERFEYLQIRSEDKPITDERICDSTFSINAGVERNLASIPTDNYQTPVKLKENFHDNTFSINEGVQSFATTIHTDNFPTPVKQEEPLDYSQTQSEDKPTIEEDIFDISTATTDEMMAIIKKQAAKAEKARAQAEKCLPDSEDARKRARRLKKNEAKRRRRRNMSDEKRQLERVKNMNRSRKWRERKRLEKQMKTEVNEEEEEVLAALDLEVQNEIVDRGQEVVQVQSAAHNQCVNTNLLPSNVESNLPTRESSLETLQSFVLLTKKPRVTKLLTPEQLEQRREVYRSLTPEQKREHNKRVVERRKQRVLEMTEEERREHYLKEYVKYVERYRKRKEKMKNDTPDERKERLKEWRESKRRTREKKKLQDQGSLSGEEVKVEVEDQMEVEVEEEAQLEDISLCYGNYGVQTFNDSFEGMGCQMDLTDIYGYNVMNQESSKLKFL